MPLVSVIVPNYNHAPFLRRRFESIIRQTRTDLEIIILDDCSTDNSKEVIEEYRKSPLVSHIVYNSENSGSTFRQWAKGISLAQGEFIWIAESDDFCEPAFLEELLPALEHNKRMALAFCQSMFVTTDNRITDKTRATRLESTLEGGEFLRTRLLGSNAIVNASMALFRKSCALFSPEYQGMKYCGDWLFWVNICLGGDVYESGKYLNYYLRHDNNVASTATRKGYDFLEGNRIYHFVKSKVSVGSADKKQALKERVIEYLRKRDALADASIRKEVWASMMELDPAIKSLINRMTWEARVKNYTAKLLVWYNKSATRN